MKCPSKKLSAHLRCRLVTVCPAGSLRCRVSRTWMRRELTSVGHHSGGASCQLGSLHWSPPLGCVITKTHFYRDTTQNPERSCTLPKATQQDRNKDPDFRGSNIVLSCTSKGHAFMSSSGSGH